MEHELIDSFWDLFVYDATAAISDAAHTKITENGFVQEFEQYTPKIYTEKPKAENTDSVFHFTWSSPPKLGSIVFQGVQSVGIIVKQGWYDPTYVVYANNITKENIHQLVSGVPEDVKEKYTIDQDRLYDFLKSKYAPKSEPKKEGGKKRRGTKRKKRHAK